MTGESTNLVEKCARTVPARWQWPLRDETLVRDELLHEFFEASADARPKHPALVCGDITLSYCELEERANKLARYLRLFGAGKEEKVGHFLPKTEHAYIAILAILKSGAAYVPMDTQIPPERAGFILQDCGAKCLVTTSELAKYLGNAVPPGVKIICVDTDAAQIEAMPPSRIARTDTGLSRENLCYLIYTSGTTGRPKGVQLEHRNATNLVRAESLLYGANKDDRISQLASLSFDASVEELWLAFFHGATLVAGTKEIMQSGQEFAQRLNALGVTVLSCVPTFLMMLESDIPSLRILIMGGETCPQDIANRWCSTGRKVFNTYGPTEATVIATASVMEADKPVTIGKPIANYGVYLLNEKLEPVESGQEGEICIAGEGIARGYLNRPEAEKEKFVVTDKLTGAPLRLYRSADLGRYNAEGEIEYLGRADDQVKLRGFRIELAEIEAVLLQGEGVLAAAAALHTPTQQIAAYIVPRAGHTPNRAALRTALTEKLPPYMVPAFLDELAELPLTVSKKVDRKRLPPPQKPLSTETKTRTAPRNAQEKLVADTFAQALGRDNIGADEDFFLDLGGHSLLAAVAVSKLRRREGFERISVGDLYRNPTVAKLAVLAAASGAQNKKHVFHSAPTAVYFACMLAQAAGIFIIAGLYAWQWLGAFLAYGYLVVADWPVRDALLGALGVQLVTTPLMLYLTIAVKWLLLGRIKPGEHRLWGWYYLRFWFVRALVRAAPVPYLDGTPLINAYYRMMGAKIGKNVFIGEHSLSSFDTLSVGDNTSIGVDTTIDGVTVEDGLLKITPVTIGGDCYVGNRCALGCSTVLEDGSGLGDLSMLPDGTHIPKGELWSGSPAVKTGALNPMPERRAPWNYYSRIIHALGITLFPLVILAAIFPGLMLITHLGHMDEGFSFLVVAPLVALSFVIFMCAEVWLFKWLLLGRVKEGRYPVGGWFYARKWFYDQLMLLSLEVIGTFYTTLYLIPWLKALGSKLGPRSEISTIRFIHPDLFEAGQECFMADDVSIGAPHIRGGWFEIYAIKVGSRTFLGNSAVLPPGTQLGSNQLIGVLSLPPDTKEGPPPDGSSWLGSPSFNLPSRQKAQGFGESATYNPPKRLVALRLFIEFFRVLLPSTIFVVLASLIINVTDIMQDYVELEDWLMSLPILYIGAGILAILFTVLLKNILTGRYKVDEKPLWCAYVWRSELVTGLYENLAVLFFMDLLRGTPFIVWILRLFGSKFGNRCYVDTTWFTEFDLVEIGDDTALNENANIQTHLFEDRVMKMGTVKIGKRCAIGTMTTVLYNTEMADDSALGDLSLLMKGESLPPNTRWHGIPAK
jgi:non-ribosomal peptide synthetase-like protein